VKETVTSAERKLVYKCSPPLPHMQMVDDIRKRQYQKRGIFSRTNASKSYVHEQTLVE